MSTQRQHGHRLGPVFLAAFVWITAPAHAGSPLYDWQTRQVTGNMQAAVVDLADGQAAVVKHGDGHGIDSPTDPNYYPVCRPGVTDPAFFPDCNFTQTNPFFFPFCQITDPMWMPACDQPTNPAWWIDCQTNPDWDPLCQPTNPQFDPLCMPTNPVFFPSCVTIPEYDPLCLPTDPVWHPLCMTDPMHDPLCHTSGTMDLPGRFGLEQNHPNPFNPGTRIGFTLPETGPVLLTVYDLSGRRVATLVNGPRSAGTHQVTFDATGLAAGVYLYTLQAGPLQESRKLVLLK
jgi:hypothetical protein